MIQPEEVDFAGGKISSSAGKAPIHLIPTHSLRRLAERFRLGKQRKKEKAWNATTKNQEVLTDVELAMERIDHAIEHLLDLRDNLVAGRITWDPEKDKDDAAAVAWSGMYLCEATRAIEAARQKPAPLNCSACGGEGTIAPRLQGPPLPGDDLLRQVCPACKGAKAVGAKA